MGERSSRKAVYTGSFDPITLGHLNVIERSAALFDELIVGIGVNIEKRPLFSLDERLELVRQASSAYDNIAVQTFDGLAVHFVRSCGARIIIRGRRPMPDVAGEVTMLMANRHLDRDLETVFLMADKELAHVSSTLIKQIAPHATDAEMAEFVPQVVIEPLRRRLEERGAT